MSDALSAFPPRQLRARPPFSIGGTLWSIAAILMFAALLGFSVFWVAPDLATDWQVRDVAVPIRGSDLTDGSCSSQLFIHTCDATLTAAAGAGPGIIRRVHYVFGSFNVGDFTARVVADPKRPAWLTTDLGLDYFWNRVMTLILTIGLLVAAVVGGVFGMLRAARRRASWRRAELIPVPLKMVGRRRIRGGVVWTIRAENGERVVGAVLDGGLSRNRAAARFGVAVSTANIWVKRFRRRAAWQPARSAATSQQLS